MPMPEIEKPEPEEIDPFVKRVVTVNPGDAVVIFKYDGYMDEDRAKQVRAHIAEKFGAIPFLVIDRDFDVTVLKKSVNSGSFVGLA
jgi:hypothetical protein